MRIILASASPRRKELIKKIPFLEVQIIPSSIDENIPIVEPALYVKTLAQTKAKSVYDKFGGNVVGADTVVVIDGEILGKPKDSNEARQTFRKLCGKTHEVLTGIALYCDDGVCTDYERTLVTFNEYDEAVINAYIKSGLPFDKAGGYGIQDEGLKPIVKGIDGDEDNVIGLPLQKLREMLAFFEKE